MYTLVSAYGVGKNVNAKWGTALVEIIPMNQIFAAYRSLFLTITAPFLAEPIHVDFEYFRPAHGSSTDRLEQVLEDLGNATLPTVPEIIQYVSKTVKYNDAFRAKYQVDVAAPGSHVSSVVYPDDKTEVVLSRPNTDMQDVFDKCLVSINGFFHRTDTDGEKVYVLEGGKSLIKSRQNQIGLYSFEDIGVIKSHAITPAMVYNNNVDSFLSHKAYFDLSGKNVAGKTVIFVIGGYMYLPFENTVSQVNDDTFVIDFNHVPVLERYFEALPYLDMSSLGLPLKPSSPTQINIAEFFKDEHFLKYLTHAQSFVVVVDTPRMYAEKHVILHRKVPGHYVTYFEPTQPLITANGRVAEYWKVQEDAQWGLKCHDAAYHNRVARSVDPVNLITTTDASQPYRTYQNSVGYLLSLGADVPV